MGHLTRLLMAPRAGFELIYFCNMEKTLMHERFERFVKTAFNNAPGDIYVDGIMDPVLDGDDETPVTLNLRELSSPLLNGFDEKYQEEVIAVGAEHIRYETVALEAIQDFQRFLILNYHLENDAVTQVEAFCGHLSAELTAELLREVHEAKNAEDRGFEGRILPFKRT